MIFNVPTGGGRKATLPVYGAVDETITITGKNGNVITVADGGSVALKYGTYTVKGSISDEALPQGRQITVDKYTTEITAYPDGMVYWFGRFASGYDAFGIRPTTGKDLEKQKNLLYIDIAQNYLGSIVFTPMVSRGMFTKLNFLAWLCPRNDVLANASVGLATTSEESTSNQNMWAARANCTNVTSYVGYSVDVSGLSSDAEYYVRLNNSGNEAGIKAIWFDNYPFGELSAGTNSVDVLSGTYRWTTANTSNPWLTAGSYSNENYIGANSTDQNTALVPIGSFDFYGTSTRIRLEIYGYCPSINFRNDGFRWAICTSNANKTLYQTTADVTADNTQIAKGTATFDYNNGNYKTYYIDLVSNAIPANTPLYLYFWPMDASTDVAHFKAKIKASLYYEV